jgi:hypothetical protein
MRDSSRSEQGQRKVELTSSYNHKDCIAFEAKIV